MDVERARSVLTQVATGTFEDTAFLFTEPLDGAPSWDEALIEARLDFGGEAKGWLKLTVGRSLAARLPATLLGLEPGEDPQVDAGIEDALGELLNIMAGTVLGVWFSPRCIFEIGTPEVVGTTVDDYARSIGEATCSTAVLTEEGEPIAITACITDEPVFI